MKQPIKIIFVLITVFALTSLSCQAMSNWSAEPTSTAYPENSQGFGSGIKVPGEVLFFDDFSNSASGWDESTDESGTTGYVNEKYKITISTDNYYYWSNPGLFFGDVIIEVEANLDSGSSQNDIGIICRLVDNDNFYFLTISSDGYYQISKFINSEEEFVGMQEYGFNSDAIKEDGLNVVRAECIGNELALFANNVELARVTDLDFQQGDVGLIAGTYDEPELSVLFDNFKVTAP